ncbi:glutamate--cysteine ligase [Acinetobacter qingfengensis]|uniref:Glutamate--cysteine ligase n=1 Tax=Acinetobacter qingfengensis TaxID=1262585 RepID=A0A1E7R4X0_9GAMM|nr:glutamate--cysteine ligase [Acinetobacter qingfengensis]KAA8732385.1 glutamate--cysteine ligase [Acinetobacter qingfengensis]OEY94380.1 glutamate--cysteine ligase [Acinetobacter qingfengensis]
MTESLNASSIVPTWLTPNHLQGMLRGIERESLRMQSNGFLSQQPHPKTLGAALTHPFITTDYSEALMEFITPPQPDIAKALEFLENIHAYAAKHLPEGESLWPLSMPCMLDEQEENIPLAQYGHSNIGRFKTLYRRGLGVRYGRRMQTISGVHYNLSFPDQLFASLQQQEQNPLLKKLNLQDYRSHRYFGLIRNFLRLIPMVMYLLGASPTVCRCFVTGRKHQLQPLVGGTLYLPDATALRMGRLGYQNSAQRQLGIHYNHLPDYLTGMRKAIRTPYPAFQSLGLNDANGEPIQINDHVLQIENEYYSLIRPKQTPQGQETPSQALEARGVAYVELRAVDVNPFSPIGINTDSAAFLEILALYCLLDESPKITENEQDLLDKNQAITVTNGRDPQLELHTLSGTVKLQQWMRQHFAQMQGLAELLDQNEHDQIYQNAFRCMQQRCDDVSQTLSSQILDQTKASSGTWSFGANTAKQHQTHYQQYALSDQLEQYFNEVALQSITQQQHLESQPQPDFCDYIKPYRNLLEN